MVFYRGPAVIGGNEMDQVTQIKPSGNSSRFAIDIGLDSFQLGVVFLIGNCICMAAYLALQVSFCYIHQSCHMFLSILCIKPIILYFLSDEFTYC